MKKMNFDLTIASNALVCPNPSEWYAKAYVTEDIVNNFRVIPGVKNSTKVSTATFTSVLKAESCDFSASASALDAVSMSVCPIQVQVEVCKKTIESSYVSLEMAKGSQNFTVQSFMENYWTVLSSEVNDEIASIRWIGNTATASFTGATAHNKLCDGYVKLLNADAKVIDITMTAVTVSNVIDSLGAALIALPSAAKAKKSELRFYVASDVYTAYMIAAAKGNTMNFVTEALNANYVGIPLVEQPYLPAGNIVLTRKDNLVYLLDGESDSTDLVAVDLTQTIGVANLRTAAWMKIGFGLTNPEEIVFVH